MIHDWTFVIHRAKSQIANQESQIERGGPMSSRLARLLPVLALLVVGLTWLMPAVSGQGGQPSTRNGEWPSYTGDVRGTRYSPLDQINAANFSRMEVAWRFKTDAF